VDIIFLLMLHTWGWLLKGKIMLHFLLMSSCKSERFLSFLGLEIRCRFYQRKPEVIRYFVRVGSFFR